MSIISAASTDIFGDELVNKHHSYQVINSENMNIL